MTNLTGSELNSLIEVKTMLEKQGFRIHTIDTIKDFREYDVCASYGDNEVYLIKVDPIANKYDVYHKRIAA